MYPTTEVQFADHKSRAVSVWFDGHDFQSTGIAFEDYTRMQTSTHKSSGDRRLPTPEWATNYSKLRSVITRYYEYRAGLFTQQPGTERERLQRAQARIQEQKPQKLAVLDRLCAEYVEGNRTGADPARLQQLQAQIENVDTVISLIDRGPGVFVAICYFYYHVRLDSPGVSEALGGVPKPVAIRQTLNRLAHVWEDIQSGRNRRIYKSKEPKEPKYTGTLEEKQAQMRAARSVIPSSRVPLKASKPPRVKLSPEEKAAHRKKIREERFAAGLCQYCGRERRAGKTVCEHHAEYNRKYYLKHYVSKRKVGGPDAAASSSVKVEPAPGWTGPNCPDAVMAEQSR
jgi:hypothetical protein